MKITLCGSTRFMDQFHQANVQLSLLGHIVYSVATSTKGDFQPTPEQKLMLDAVHMQKIDNSDAIVIVGRLEDGSLYLGESTRREMMYARAAGKDVYFFDAKVDQVEGPWQQYEHDSNCAGHTYAYHEQKRKERAERQRVLMEQFGIPSTEDAPPVQ